MVKGNVLITQELSSQARQLFDKLGRKHNVKMIYHSFLRIEGIDMPSFRKLGLKIRDYSAIVFTNKVAVDNFFELLKKLEIELPLTIRYFCSSEQLAMYLKKYITLRKRRLHFPKKVKGKDDLTKIMEKYKDEEKFLFVGGANSNHKLLQFLKKNKYDYAFLPVYELLPNPYGDISSLREFLLISFSAPAAVEAYVDIANKDKELLKVPVGVYGNETKKVAKRHKLNVVFAGPTKDRKSLYTLIDNYLYDILSSKN